MKQQILWKFFVLLLGASLARSSQAAPRVAVEIQLRKPPHTCSSEKRKTAQCDGEALGHGVLILRRINRTETRILEADDRGRIRFYAPPGYYQLSLDYQYSYSLYNTYFGNKSCDFTNEDFSCPEQSGCYPISLPQSQIELPRQYSTEKDPGISTSQTEANQFFHFKGNRRKLILSFGQRCI